MIQPHDPTVRDLLNEGPQNRCSVRGMEVFLPPKSQSLVGCVTVAIWLTTETLSDILTSQTTAHHKIHDKCRSHGDWTGLGLHWKSGTSSEKIRTLYLQIESAAQFLIFPPTRLPCEEYQGEHRQSSIQYVCLARTTRETVVGADRARETPRPESLSPGGNPSRRQTRQRLGYTVPGGTFFQMYGDSLLHLHARGVEQALSIRLREQRCRKEVFDGRALLPGVCGKPV